MKLPNSETAAVPTDAFVLAVDLGGTHLRSAIVDEDGKALFRLKQKTPAVRAPDALVHVLVDAAHAGESQLSAGGSICAISVAFPGSVNVSAGSVMQAPNLSCLNGFPLAEALSQELRCPVILENDANAAAVGEMWRGAARGRQSIVCLTLGTGVGGGIILDGKLWRGANGSAAEIGHMCVDPFGDVACNCGSDGCLEVYASATAIVRMTREALARYPNSLLQASKELTAEDVYRAGVKGDDLAIEVFRRMGDYLGIGMVNLINILNPEMIVIVGGAASAWDLFERDMNRRVANRAFPLPALRIPIVRGECGDDAGLLGAARLGFDYILSKRCPAN
jgi:glucokinase